MEAADNAAATSMEHLYERVRACAGEYYTEHAVELAWSPSAVNEGGIKVKGLLVASIALAFLVAVCRPAHAAVEINWWHAFNGQLGKIVSAQVKQFNESQSDYVVVDSFKGGYHETVNAGLAATTVDKQPHLLMVLDVHTSSILARADVVVPMHQIMSQSGIAFEPERFLSPIHDYYASTENELLSFPYNTSTPVLYVNRTALKNAGIDPDTNLATWRSVGLVADKLLRKDHKCPFSSSWQSWVHLENYSAYHNLPFATNDNGYQGLDSKLLFNSEQQVEHIDLLARWARTGKFVYAGRQNEAAVNFRSGDCALYTDSSAMYLGVKKLAKFKFDMRPLPYTHEIKTLLKKEHAEKQKNNAEPEELRFPLNTTLGGASLWAMAGHDAEEYKGVAKFIQFLAQGDVQAKWLEDTGFMPVTLAGINEASSNGYYKKHPGTDVANKQMSVTETTVNSRGLRLGRLEQIRLIIDEELESVWAGTRESKAALDSAVERGNEVLQRFEAGIKNKKEPPLEAAKEPVIDKGTDKISCGSRPEC